MRSFSPAISTSLTSRTSTCSSDRPESSAFRTSCCGSRRMRRWCFWTPCGPTSIAVICGKPSRSTPAATAATAVRFPTRQADPLLRPRSPSCEGGAVGAGAEDLDVVGDSHEAVFGADLFGPSLYRRALNLDRAPAIAAHEVVVMAVGAAPVDRLTVPSAQNVHFPGVGQRLQCPVDRGQADGVTARTQDRVNVLCAAKVVDFVEDRRDRCALPGRPGPRRAVLAYHGHLLATPPCTLSLRPGCRQVRRQPRPQRSRSRGPYPAARSR